MNEDYFLSTRYLPEGFHYPEEFKIVVNLGLVDFVVWNFIDTARAKYLLETINTDHTRYIPFAEQRGSDDVACWDVSRPGVVVIIENSSGNDGGIMQLFETFFDWFRVIFNEMIDHINDEIKYG